MSRVEAPMAFKISAFIFFLSCVAVLVILSQSGRFDLNRERRHAKAGAQAIGQYLVKNKFMVKTFPLPSDKPSRGLASESTGPMLVETKEGELGRDPWGYPFKFKVLTSQTNKSYVLVWSAGENHEFESSPSLEQSEPSLASLLKGDDLGSLIPVSEN